MMCVERESFGVDETLAAADAVACRCGGDCPLPNPTVESVVRWQAEPDD